MVRERGNEIKIPFAPLEVDKQSENSLYITSKHNILQNQQIDNSEILPSTLGQEESKTIFDFEKFGSKEGFTLGNDNALPAWAIVAIVAIIFSAIVAVVCVICCYKLITKSMDLKNANKSASSKHQAVEEGQTEGKQILQQQPTQQGNTNGAVTNPQIEGRQNVNTTSTTPMFEFPQQAAI
ncbi:MAG: hypothetical protein EZS28_009741 [Streblomastix strix]|uniref:Uncharacterized protein n=1 Tax=Streblomastix strix TaxID=222440 RepID=A0A5J4WJ43_9EUKA|nr:MAG: hypothetical protein EZS28_009741 [Streblomastix strix]